MTSPVGFIPYLPERVHGLASVAMNLWWSWNLDGRDLFRAIDANLWHRTRHNPLELLQRVEPARLQESARDPAFLALYDRVMDTFGRLENRQDTWFERHHHGAGGRPVAYFCAEFALHNSIPVYSGGLGVLAGDHCKASSDLGVPLVAVGLYYLRGYFDQRLRADGWQEDSDEVINSTTTPLTPVLGPDGEASLVVLRTAERDVHIGAWKLMAGRVPVYLLDTDLERNDPADRELSHKLYTGNRERRLKQEWILGVGGVRVLRALGVDPAAWHANEGHAAFMFVERLRELTSAGMTLDEGIRRIRSTSIFTTHTPVPAGHDTFPIEEVERVTGPFWDDMRISREVFAQIGAHPTQNHGHYHMTVAALRLAGRVNGVAARHERESRHIWRDLWSGRDPLQVPIRHVTNGVHLGTWMAHPIRTLLASHLGADWEERLDEPGLWERVLDLDDAGLWRVHERLRQVLHSFIREEARHRWRVQWKDPAKLAVAGTLIGPTALTIGFARRFASYKRADLMLRDTERLRRLLVNVRRPVQLVFAGKAHPADEPGKKILQRVYTAAQDPTFEGRIAFLEDYELHLAHRLVQGVDLWLNVPRVPMEACGTSGMKAALNGVPQISTLDGWWAEGYTGTNGWAIPLAGPDADTDEADVDSLFSLIEEQVVPRFYERDALGLPRAWIQMMKHAIRTAGERFTARRMVQEYVTDYYLPAGAGDLPHDDPPTA
jgi:starch phosphorylase